MTRIVTTDAFLPNWLPSNRAFMTAEILFEDIVDGKTKYTATARHWSAEAKAEHEAMGFHEGWGKAAEFYAATFPDSQVVRVNAAPGAFPGRSRRVYCWN